MLYNSISKKFYDINFKAFYENLNDLYPSISKINNSRYFLDKWLSLLKNAYNNNKNLHPYFDIEKIFNKSNEGQIFGKSVGIAGENIVLNSCISLINKHVNELGPSTTIDISDFLSGWIEYIHTEKFPPILKSTPIYIALLPSENTIGFVLDGNHRLTKAIELKKTSIEAFYLPPEIVAISLLTVFEQYIYRLFIDIHLINCSHCKDIFEIKEMLFIFRNAT